MRSLATACHLAHSQSRRIWLSSRPGFTRAPPAPHPALSHAYDSEAVGTAQPLTSLSRPLHTADPRSRPTPDGPVPPWYTSRHVPSALPAHAPSLDPARMTPISAHTSPVSSRSSPARLLKFLPARLETLASTQPAHTSCLPAPLACAPRINRLPIAACSGSCLLMPPPLTTHGLQSASRAHDLALPYHADTSPPVRPAPGPDSDGG